jgi:putative ABC transport system permease protein
MFRNYIVVAIRTLFRQKGYSLLNILGLAIGMAACLLITSFVREDIMWDSFHKNSDNIYRVSQVQSFGGIEPQHVAYTAFPVGPAMEADLPEVVSATRFHRGNQQVFSIDDTRILQDDIAYVDPSFLKIFSYPLLVGDAETVLDQPNSVLMKEEVAKKYFGDENPIGQMIQINDEFEAVVTGLLDEFPARSHLNFDVIFPMDARLQHYPDERRENWGNNSMATYVLVSGIESVTEYKTKMNEFFAKNRDMENVEFYLEPFSDIHLNSGHIKYQINENRSSMKSVYTVSIIASFLLIIAVINYMNLATARSIRRAREVGMRKVVGANRANIIFQFLGESMILTTISMILAVVTAKLIEPYFGELAGREVIFNPLDGSFGTFSIIAITLFTGIVSGLYPAFILSSFKPISVLKGRFESKSSGTWMRRGLVVFQFVTSITFIIGISVVLRQMHYAQYKDLGYDKEHVLGLYTADEGFWDRWDDHKVRFENIPGVTSVSASGRIPVWGGGQTSVTIDGFDDEWLMSYYLCDEDQQETMGMEMALGRFFSKDFPTDVATFDSTNQGALVLNEAAVRKLGWENPLGKEISMWSTTIPVIGVVKDFHFAPLTEEIEPMMFVNSHYDRGFFSLRVSTDDIPALVENVEAVWGEIMPGIDSNHFFLNEIFEQLYTEELRLSTLLKIFSGLTIFIACLGLVGLASYATQRRTKEISVRKVLGASVPQILTLVSKEFAILVVVANLVAWPIAYYLMNMWLENFAYKLSIAWWIFPLAGIAAFVIALISTAWQAWRAALTNPSQALRSE